MRIVRKALFGVALGVFFGAVWPWVQGVYAHPPATPLAGLGQTFQAMDRHYFLYCLVVYTLCGAAFGVLVKSAPSRGVQAFATVNFLGDLLTCWW